MNKQHRSGLADDTPRRPAIVIALHWLMLAALLFGVLLIFVRDEVVGRVLHYLHSGCEPVGGKTMVFS